MSEGGTVVGMSITTVCLLWGIITQCLSWGNVIQWPWYAIWGPFLFIIALWVLAFIVTILIMIIAVIARRK